MEGQQILALYKERNQLAIQETDLSYGKQLQALAKRILENEEDAEEVKNDTYWKAWKAIPPAYPTYFYAYLAKICRHLSLDRLDWKKAKKRNGEVVALTREMEECIPGAEPEWLSEQDAIRQVLNGFLRKLSAEQRRIFLRRYWYMDSIDLIAKRYGIGKSKVKTDLFRMRQKLRKELEMEGIGI